MAAFLLETAVPIGNLRHAKEHQRKTGNPYISGI
jgi:hypothetical protein